MQSIVYFNSPFLKSINLKNKIICHIKDVNAVEINDIPKLENEYRTKVSPLEQARLKIDLHRSPICFVFNKPFSIVFRAFEWTKPTDELARTLSVFSKHAQTMPSIDQLRRQEETPVSTHLWMGRVTKWGKVRPDQVHSLCMEAARGNHMGDPTSSHPSRLKCPTACCLLSVVPTHMKIRP